MKHGAVNDQIREVTALYALGALNQHEARALEEHLNEGCEVCREELESFEMTAAELSLAAIEAEPPRRIRDELLSKVGGQTNGGKGGDGVASSTSILSIHADQGKWKELCDGVLLKKLFVDQATGLTTSLVRMKAGTALPVHRHIGVEQFYILEGDCHVHGERLGPGDFHRAETGSIHRTTYTVEGTMFLLIAPESYEVLDAR